MKSFGNDKFTEYVSDVVSVWYVHLMMLGIAFVIGFIYLLVLKLVGGLIIFISIVLIFIALAAGGVLCWSYKDTYPAGSKSNKALEIGAYVLWGLSALYILIVLCCIGRIKLGIAIFKATADFIGDVKTVFIVPFSFTLLIGIWMLFWTVSAAFIFSIGTPEPRIDATFLTNVKWSKETRYVFLYHLFGLLWLNAFIIGCAQFIIAAAACQWYFSHSADTSGKGSILKGLKWVMVYHLGTIAFGSFCIAVVQFIRIIFEYYTKQMKKLESNPVAKCLICCTRCCLWCLEKCIKFISKNAFI